MRHQHRPGRFHQQARTASLALLLAFGVTGSAFADDNHGQSNKDSKDNKGNGNGGAGTEHVAPLSNAEQVAQAQMMVSRGSDLSERVGHMLDAASREGDIIKVTCLNDKLTQINANVHTAQSRMASLQSAATNDERNHEFTVLSVLSQKFQVLDQEANQCVGQDLYETGKTTRVTEIEKSLLPFETHAGEPPVALPPGNVPPEVPRAVSGTH